MTDRISTRRGAALPTNADHSESTWARTEARWFKSRIGPEVDHLVELPHLGLPAS